MNPEAFEGPDLDPRLAHIGDALSQAYEYFLHRDEMNGRIHCDETRLSPITELMAGALGDHGTYVTDLETEAEQGSDTPEAENDGQD